MYVVSFNANLLYLQYLCTVPVLIFELYKVLNNDIF